MKKLMSIMMLVVILFFTIQIGVILFTKGHEKNYKIYNEEKEFSINEKYEKGIYSINIKYNDNNFNYVVSNDFNKQKKIIKYVEYYENDGAYCIYPILVNNTGTYIECYLNGEKYTEFSYPNGNDISSFKSELAQKGYTFDEVKLDDDPEKYGNISLYTKNLPKSDAIVYWNYKGALIFKYNKDHEAYVLNFDKYENKLGHVAGKYYVIPNYKNSKVLEFSSVFIVNVDRFKVEEVNLGYTLSSSTYLNGVVDNKLYYTDPSNLIQLEINPSSKNIRLIGNSDISAQMYNGKWSSVNIYDFKSHELLFKDTSRVSEYSYVDVQKGISSYYFYNSNGEVFQIGFNEDDTPMLLFKASGLNNFNVVGNDIYYVVGNTLYLFNLKNGSIPVFVDKDLQYNNKNRIGIYRK